MHYLENLITCLRKKSIRILVIITCMISILLFLGKSYIMVVFYNENASTETYGIIDGHLSKKHENLLKINSDGYVEFSTHGDQILQMLKEYSKNTKFYYYDAEIGNDFLSESILNALEWMKKNGVRYVSISLSSKFYSDEVQSWISKNKNDIVIYASYNNELNTLDYPAKYNDVIGVGSSPKIEKKKCDVIMKSSKIVLISNKLKFYYGNSFLTPYVMLRDTINNKE